MLVVVIDSSSRSSCSFPRDWHSNLRFMIFFFSFVRANMGIFLIPQFLLFISYPFFSPLFLYKYLAPSTTNVWIFRYHNPTRVQKYSKNTTILPNATIIFEPQYGPACLHFLGRRQHKYYYIYWNDVRPTVLPRPKDRNCGMSSQFPLSQMITSGAVRNLTPRLQLFHSLPYAYLLVFCGGRRILVLRWRPAHRSASTSRFPKSFHPCWSGS